MQIDRPITIALILFIILLLVFFLVLPEYNMFKKLQVEYGDKKAEYEAEFEYYNEIAATEAELQSRSEDIAKIDDALPTDPDLGKVIYFLHETAVGNGMIIKSLFLSKSSLNSVQNNLGKVKDIVFSVDIVGDYSSLEKFLISLEKSSRLFEITNISFGSSSQLPAGSGQTQFQTQQIYTFGLQIKTHSY